MSSRYTGKNHSCSPTNQAACASSARLNPASEAPITATMAATTYRVVGRSSRSARRRTQVAHVCPAAWCAVHDVALAYPPTMKNTGMTWKISVSQRPQLI
jgi:hypothetical protein